MFQYPHLKVGLQKVDGEKIEEDIFWSDCKPWWSSFKRSENPTEDW